MSGPIFISYRRDDSSPWAGRLYDDLNRHFVSNQIFMDVDTIQPGVDFVEAIEKNVGSCDVLIAVIGKRWLISSDEEGARRLDNPEDSVRIEILTALKRGVRVIPVLVDGATMPRSRDLPDDLKSLARRNALEVSHNRFRTDSERRIAALEHALESAKTEHQSKHEEELFHLGQRKRAENERLETRRHETDAKERLEAEGRQKEEQERVEHEPQSQPLGPVAPSTPSVQSEEPYTETPKLPPKPSEPERKKPPPTSSGGTGGKSKPVIAFLTIAAVLGVIGLVYLATRQHQSPPSQPVPASASPSQAVVAPPTPSASPSQAVVVAPTPSASPSQAVVVAPTPSELKIVTFKAQVAKFQQTNAVVVWDIDQRSGVLQLDKLPPPAPGKDYQLWVIDPSNPLPVSAGVLSVPNDGLIRTSFHPAAPVKSAVAFAISLEKTGGSSKPEGQIILLGK